MLARVFISLFLLAALCGAQPRRVGYQKPPRGAIINWSHPLTRGLRHCWPLAESGGEPRDIVTGERAVSTAGPTWESGAWSFDGSASFSDLLSFPPALNDFTFVHLMRINVLGLQYSRVAEHDSYSDGWAINKDNAGADTQYRLSGVGGSGALLDITNYDRWALWVSRRQGDTWSMMWLPIVNDVPTLSNIGGVTDATVLGRNNDLRVGQYVAGGSYYTDMSSRVIYYYDRYVTNAELNNLRRAPYQFLHSAYTRRRILTAAAASTTRRQILIFNFLLWLGSPGEALSTWWGE